jgi:hypothetical protein
MHLVIPHLPASTALAASPLKTALQGVALPHLTRLLQALSPSERIATDAFDWHMPHERLLATLHGLPTEHTPWAAWESHTSGTACAWIHPVHWHVGMDHITMSHPSALPFDEALSREVLAVLTPFFAEVGVHLEFEQPNRWLARGDMFEALPCASLDRAVGRNIDAWMPPAASERGAQLRRLQNEVQMLLYTHPITERIERSGQTAMNSFWVSGAGRLDSLPAGAPNVQVDTRLQQAVYAQDAAAYRQAWQALDASPLKTLCEQLDKGQPVTLSLCSDNAAQSFENRPLGFASKLLRRLGAGKQADWSRWL